MGPQKVRLPIGAKIVLVESQGGELFLWAEVDSEVHCEDRKVWVIGTGNPMPARRLVHLGSVMMWPFVWHVYEEP